MQKPTLEGVRLSSQQKHVWLLQREEQNLPYRTQCAILIEGNLNRVILKTVLENIVKRHEILRTSFNCLPGMEIPVQVINNGRLSWSHERDLSGWDTQQQKVKIEALFHEISQNSCDFEQDSLLYVSLVILSPQKYILILSLPALVSDSQTLKNLVREISSSYTACLHGEEIYDEPIQYADISEWQHELLEGEDTKIGREYWRKQDISAILSLHLPFENQPQGKPDFQPQFLDWAINPELLAKLEALASKYDTSVSVLLLVCWQILLWRLTGHSEMIVGTASNGRNYEELEPALGLFAKYLPLQCHLSENSQFNKLLKQVDESLQQVFEWQETFTWEQIEIKKEKASKLSFFPFCFDFESQSRKYSAENILFSIYRQYTCIDRFNLKLSCLCQDDDLKVEFHYNSNLFDAENIERLAGQFQKLLSSILNKPEATISELEFLSHVELQQLLREFNNTQTEYPSLKCIHQLFEEQVEQTPNNIAVKFENQKLTYRELNACANKLAHHLHKLGVGSEVLVGLCVERSLEMIVGILGILKAGGAYVPLDPTYPQERLAFILNDTQTSVLLTQQRLVENLPENRAKIICLDTNWEVFAVESKENPTVEMTAENLAYIIYTSGSTGKPKGVQITHQNLVNSTHARINYYQEPITNFLLLSSFAFDSSVAGIFWTLCCGGTLLLPQGGGERDILQIIELIAQNHISNLLSLPSLYELLLEQASSEQLDSLRTVIVAGEVCPKELFISHLKLLPKTSFFNEYGPTEGTVWSSVYNCHSSELKTQVSIGRPIANTQIYLLDSHLHPVSLGVPGELYISGDGLARGYLNRPDLTGEKFIPNPFSSNQQGLRLYKTGDLARYLQDGNIEFLGRIDHQVKIRGFRVELGEIEAILKQNSAVNEVVVVAREEKKEYLQQNWPTVSSSMSQENTELLLTQMLLLGQEKAEQQLAELERLSEDELEEILAREMPDNSIKEKARTKKFLNFPNFEISLQIDSKFINPPQSFQRNWLLKQALDELADDLMHLDNLSRRFVVGNENKAQNDLSKNQAKYEHSLSLFENQQIMEDWLIPLMKAMADIVTETHGDVLEVGFGRGVSATFIQECGVKSHTIIECDDAVVEAFYQWKELYPERDIRLIQGKWQDVKNQLDIYNGIFFQTNVLNEEQLVEDVVKSVTFAEHFFPTAVEHLRAGGIFTYLTHEIDSFSRRHQRLVFKYFSSLTLSVAESLSIPENTKDLWWADSMVVVKCIK